MYTSLSLLNGAELLSDTVFLFIFNEKDKERRVQYHIIFISFQQTLYISFTTHNIYPCSLFVFYTLQFSKALFVYFFIHVQTHPKGERVRGTRNFYARMTFCFSLLMFPRRRCFFGGKRYGTFFVSVCCYHSKRVRKCFKRNNTNNKCITRI